MPSDSTALLAPDPAHLPLLYEAGRLLGRGLDPLDSLAPLLTLLAPSLGRGLAAGVGAGGGAEDDDLVFVAATDPGDGHLVGRRLSFGSLGLEDIAGLEGAADGGGALLPLMSRAYEMGQAQGEGRLFALPALVGGRVVAVLGFLGATQIVGFPAQALAEGAAALYAEAFLLRRQLAEEARRRSVLEADGGPARPNRPRPGFPAAIPAAPAPARAAAIAAAAATAPAKAAPAPARAAPAASVTAGDAPSPQALSPLLGHSQAMAAVRAFIGRVAPTESTVLLLGESGTGKEVAARVIHGASARAGGPFVAVNCAALPAALIESELFGHERGSFTGAQARRLGRFELAAGGTLFLDEVAEIPLGLQAKLLRVLQERSFERVGGTRSIKAELRILAATNRDLEAEVAAGRFRADLYWRLAVFPLRMPPLRERGGDIVLLADHFTEGFAASTGRPVSRISTPALDLLTSYHWPGNVRELQNAIERAVILSTDGVIHAYHLPPSLQSADSTGTGPASTLDAALARLERELLVEALKIEAGNAAAAARRLGVSERRMGLALKRYGIDWRRFRRLGR